MERLSALISELSSVGGEGRKSKEKTFSNKKQKFLNRKWKNAFSIADGGLKMVLSLCCCRSLAGCLDIVKRLWLFHFWYITGETRIVNSIPT